MTRRLLAVIERRVRSITVPVSLALLSIFTFAHATTFGYLCIVDEAGILGPNYQIRVTGWNEQHEASELYEHLTNLARDRGMTISRVEADLYKPESSRHLYTASPSGEPEEYSYYSRNASTTVRPLNQTGQSDPRGYYAITGSPQDAQAAHAMVISEGGRASLAPYGDLAWHYRTFTGAYLKALLVMGLGIVLASSATAIIRSRRWAIERMLGHGLVNIASNSLRQQAAITAVAWVACTLIAMPLLWTYNRLHWGTLHLILSTLIGLALVAVAALAFICGLIVAFHIPILDGIKGRMAGTGTLCAMYLLYACAIALTFATASQAIAAGGNLASTRRPAPPGAATLSVISITGTSEDQDATVSRVGRWLTSEANRKNLLYAQQDYSPYFIPGSDLPPTKIVTVNDTYLEIVKVSDEHGQVSADESSLRVLIPPDLMNYREQISGAVADWGRFAAGQAGAAPPAVESSTLINRRIYAFAYRPDSSAWLDQPIMIILPRQPIISELDLGATATGGAALIRDPRTLSANIISAQVQNDIVGINSLAQAQAEATRSASRELRTALFSFLLSASILFYSSACLTWLYQARAAQRIFVQFAHGWSGLQIHRLFLVGQSLIAASIVAFALRRGALSSEALGRAIPPSPGQINLQVWDVPVAVGTATTALIVIFGCLALQTRKLVATRSSEALQ